LAPARALLVMAKGVTGITVTVAVACELGLAALAAVIVTEVLLVTLTGVKAPLLEILPELADQVTAVFAVPLTLAVKFCCPFEGMVVLLGEIEMVILGLLLETMICKEVDPDCVEKEVDPDCVEKEVDPDCVEDDSDSLCAGTRGRLFDTLSDTRSTEL